MQVNSRWNAPTGPLGRLTAAADGRAQALESSVASLRERALARDLPPSFAAALRAGTTVSVIAELKRRSPSKGTLNAGLEAAGRASLYAECGARALSILTEPEEFGGSTQDLLDVSRRVSVPLLKKDFHVAESQVWEARANGASAILFIARALPPDRLPVLVRAARAAGLDALVEIRTDEELARAVDTEAAAIGVNARDLETLEIEPWVTERLIPKIPSDRVRIAESGMSNAADVERVASFGADAVLIGSALSSSADPRATLAALCAVPRLARGRAGGRAGGHAGGRADGPAHGPAHAP